ncbi:Acyl-CoA dehydrogenase family member 11 [Venturia inaequalis]|nr:Acyl-CoA dehydrogenase family member 11 [Venturia inaequalis]
MSKKRLDYQWFSMTVRLWISLGDKGINVVSVGPHDLNPGPRFFLPPGAPPLCSEIATISMLGPKFTPKSDRWGSFGGDQTRKRKMRGADEDLDKCYDPVRIVYAEV